MGFLCYLCSNMKKPLSVIALAVLLSLSLSGCDRIRASLGKPTSADLAVLRQQKADRERAVRDSIVTAKAEAARIAAEAAAAEAAEAAVVRRYYAVAGAFKEESGAQVYIEKLRQNGFKVRTFDFKSGLKVVCADGSDSLDVVRRDLTELRKIGIDPWIYNTNQKLHKEI